MALLAKQKDLQEQLNELKRYDYDFENLVFSGGGVKTGCFYGCLEVLDDLGILRKCKRFAGTSGGSYVATLLALNLGMSDIKKEMHIKLKDLILDSPFGPLSMLPNIVQKFGWNPGDKFLNAIRDILEAHTGNPDITFREIYKRYNNVLCIVATNVSTMSVEYFHPKTTPNFSVALAIRCSIAVPGYLQPVLDKTQDGMPQYYTEGGLVCNYPLHCFDGWYLSLKTEDSFFSKLGGNIPHFKDFNSKTLGFLLYNASEGGFMRGDLHSRQLYKKIERPKTPLALARQQDCDDILQENENKRLIVEAGKRFLKTLRQAGVDQDHAIPLQKFKTIFNKLMLCDTDAELIFGENFHIEDAFDQIDTDSDGKITFNEFLWYMQRKGVIFHALIEGGTMTTLHNFAKFFCVTLNIILNTTEKVFHKKGDSHRTVGIYTDYVDTTDFTLQEADKQFMAKQGITGSVVYFRELVQKYKEGKLPAIMKGCIKQRDGTISNFMKGCTKECAKGGRLLDNSPNLIEN